MSICCFAGHNKVYDEEIKTKLREVCKRLITQKGVNEFWVGNYGCFDEMCAAVIADLKKKYAVKLCLIIPYLTAEIVKDNTAIKEKYDEISVAGGTENSPYKYKILKTNEYMIEKAHF